ncbi:MAG: SPW repeat domain-containing protein [Solirubrobacterales bacterium]
MLTQGPIPALIHGIIEYVAAAAFIALPLLIGFESDAAIAVSIITGVVILVVAASSDNPAGLIAQIPVPVHVLLDYLLAGFLIAAPFLFGFSGETEPLVFFIGLGVAHLLITIATKFREPATAKRATGDSV